MLTDIIQIAKDAGDRILAIYNSDNAETSFKEDRSPLTAADRASHTFILNALKRLTPEIPVISEESDGALPPDFASWPRCWMVDPLDGTKEFIKRTGEFTVNIALIEDRQPVLGVVYAPATGLTYYAESGRGACRVGNGEPPIPIHVRTPNPDRMCVVASKDHAGPMVTELLARLKSPQLTSMGSSLKFCLVADGTADIYLRDVPTMEWDTAAAQCVVENAGGFVLDLEGRPLRYQKPGVKNLSIVTVGDRDIWRA